MNDVLPEYQKYLLEHGHAGLACRQATADGCISAAKKRLSTGSPPAIFPLSGNLAEEPIFVKQKVI